MNIFLTILGIAILVTGIVLFFFTASPNGTETAKIKGYGKWALVVGIVVLLTGTSFKIIPTGYTGVRTTFGQIDGATVQNGFNLKIPFVQSIKLVNNKQDVTFDDRVWSETSEQTVVYAEKITVTYQISKEKSAWIFTNVSDYSNNLVNEALVASAVKTASKQCATKEVTDRGVIEPLAKQTIQASLDEKYGAGTVTVLKVVISNMDFEDSYNNAIAERQVAQQKYEIAQIENQTAVEKANAQAEATLIEAKAQAEATLVEAKAKAEANDLLAKSVTNKTLAQDYIDKWNGELPKVTSSGNMIDISELLK